jgi:hypothetical protein
MESHPLADETLPTRTFVVSSGNRAEVTPMMRRRPDGLCNVAVREKWVASPSEADRAELNVFLEPFVRRMKPIELPGADSALTHEEADKLTGRLLLTK